MKKYLLVSIFMILSLSAFSQQRNLRNMSVEERAQFQTERMTDFLELDSTVIGQVYDINLKYAKQVEDGRNENTSRYEMMKLLEKTNNAKNKEMKQVLTKDQYKKYMRAQQEMRNRMQQRMGAGNTGQQH
jgi:hypothetical protein